MRPPAASAIATLTILSPKPFARPTTLNKQCAEAHNTVERYVEIQAQMLTELLTEYGEIPRMWWDMVSSTFSLPWNPGGFPGLFKNLSAHAKALAPRTLLLPGTDGCLVGGETGSGAYPIYNFNEGPTGYACQRMESPPNATPSLIFAPHEQDHSILNPGDMCVIVHAAPVAPATATLTTLKPYPTPTILNQQVVVDL